MSATYNWTALERNKDQFVGLIARPKEVNTLPFHYSYTTLDYDYGMVWFYKQCHYLMGIRNRNKIINFCDETFK